MKIESAQFQNNASIPSKYTCDGENINPPLAFSDIPPETKSLALIMDDPDAPAGIWVHWVIFNIDPRITKIDENSSPQNAVIGKNTRNFNRYGGPCPPDQEHRYFFKLYALNTILKLSPNTNKITLENAMREHIVDKAELIGLYNRNYQK